MQFAREINRLIVGILVLFFAVALGSAYWAIFGPDTILKRQDNPRLVEVEAAIRRGSIYDRNETLLVQSTIGDSNRITRQYLYPSMSSAIGYASLRYGVSGAESAFNTILRGDTRPTDLASQLVGNLLHRPQVGLDVRLSFDLQIQSEAVRAMGDHRGAVVLLEVPSGAVLSMVSLPTYDPNTLDQNWVELTQAPGNPFFNRVLLGTYQPGTTLQTPLMAAAILAKYPLATTYEDAAGAVEVADVRFECLQQPTTTSLSLVDAYILGCPEPFVQLVQDLGVNTTKTAFDTFQLDELPTLASYVTVPASTDTTASQFELNSQNLTENTLGQGEISVSPLEMVLLAAAIQNDGNAPTPYVLLGYRDPELTSWQTEPSNRVTLPMMTSDTAHELHRIMRRAVLEGAAQAANIEPIEIGGQVALAYAGESSQAWFIGFASLSSQSKVAIAVVLEDTSNTDEAARIARQIFIAAQQEYASGN